jgi:hypothetical protein
MWWHFTIYRFCKFVHLVPQVTCKDKSLYTVRKERSISGLKGGQSQMSLSGTEWYQMYMLLYAGQAYVVKLSHIHILKSTTYVKEAPKHPDSWNY